jgi:hypothetical protein
VPGALQTNGKAEAQKRHGGRAGDTVSFALSFCLSLKGIDDCPGRGLNHRAGALHFSHGFGSTAGRLSR